MRSPLRSWRVLAAGAALLAAGVAGVVVVAGDDDGRQHIVPATDGPEPTTPAPTVVTSPDSVPTTEPSDTSVVPDQTLPLELSDIVLRADGVGQFDFGSPMDVVKPALDAEFGEGVLTDYGISGDPVLGCDIHQSVSWTSANLTLAFGDAQIDAGGGCDGKPVLEGWRLVSRPSPAIEVQLGNGAHVGASYTALKAIWPDLDLYPQGSFWSPYYAKSDAGETPIFVEFDRSWDWVSALQQGLVDNGADIAVDGQLGERTSLAYQAFAAAHPGLSDGQLFELLGAVPLGNAPAVTLLAGPGWYGFEFECPATPEWGLHGLISC